MSKWPRCSCGHIAQHHNQARDMQGMTIGNTPGLVSGKPHGHWTKEDCEAVPIWACDLCECSNYDGGVIK